MAVDNTFFIKQLRKKEFILVAFCGFTGMPFAVCDPETFDDQVWAFDDEEQLKKFAKPYIDQEIVINGSKIMNKDFLNFFSSLYYIGINQIVCVNSAGEQVRIELSEIVNPPDFSKTKPEARPIMNPGLQLTGIYFMQEAARPVANELKPNLRDLEEEFSSNIIRSKFLLPIVLQPGPGTIPEKLKAKKYQTPDLKTKDGTIYRPLFSDQTELQKFARGKQMMALTLPFAVLEKALPEGIKGYMLNPAGYHAVLTRELLAALPKRFPELAKKNAVKS